MPAGKETTNSKAIFIDVQTKKPIQAYFTKKVLNNDEYAEKWKEHGGQVVDKYNEDTLMFVSSKQEIPMTIQHHTLVDRKLIKKSIEHNIMLQVHEYRIASPPSDLQKEPSSSQSPGHKNPRKEDDEYTKPGPVSKRKFRRQEFTDQEKRELREYLTSKLEDETRWHHPMGDRFYRVITEKPWGERHSWQSWRTIGKRMLNGDLKGEFDASRDFHAPEEESQAGRTSQNQGSGNEEQDESSQNDEESGKKLRHVTNEEDSDEPEEDEISAAQSNSGSDTNTKSRSAEPDGFTECKEADGPIESEIGPEAPKKIGTRSHGRAPKSKLVYGK